ncbi:MAG: PEGA domain-containing protein [Proteobacteria bacterium]|jgi:hypothetical protein|nr:PEGA domain-containing protein [Pseudomonadota bacterium]
MGSLERTHRALVALALAGAAAFGTAAVAAEETEDVAAKEARAHYQQGVELYEAGKFDQASVAFERAYEIRPHFKILWNIAQVENELGHYAAAHAAYSRYLEGGGGEIPAERRAEADAEIARLGTLVGTVAVESGVDGATVFVDGKKRGTTPLAGPIPLDLGDHEISVRLEAEELHREVVRVAGGRRVVVTVAAGGTRDDGAGSPDRAAENGRRVWTWVALGVGAAAGIAGGVLGGVALSKKNEIDGSCVAGQCPPRYEDDADRVERLALGADILFGVAAAGVITGVVLFFVEPKMGSEERTVVAPVVSNDAAGLAVVGRF